MAIPIPPIREVSPHQNQNVHKMPYYTRASERLAAHEIITLDKLTENERHMAYYHFLGKFATGGAEDEMQLIADGEMPKYAEGGLLANRIERDQKGARTLRALTTAVDGTGSRRQVERNFRFHPSGALFQQLDNGLVLTGYLIRSDEQKLAIDAMIAEIEKLGR